MDEKKWRVAFGKIDVGPFSSMPWVDGQRARLMFVAFGASFDAFEAQMRRMAGIDDGVTDALFRFTQPLTGAYFWCPPVRRGKVDFSRFLK